MRETNIFEFDVPIHADGGHGHVHVLLPCNASELEQFLKKIYSIDTTFGNGWSGICVFSQELDEKAGRPTAVIALSAWESKPEAFAVLAHECFHAAEWLLKQGGHRPPSDWMELPQTGGPRVVWEDAAYLLQWIMRRVLVKILNGN